MSSKTRVGVRSVIAAAALASVPCVAMASFGLNGLNVDFGNGAHLNARVTLDYGLQMRTKNPAPALAEGPAGSDGDGNFGAGNLTSNNVQALFQSSLRKGNSGVVFDATGFYDFAYHRPPHNDGRPRSTPGPLNRFPKYARYFDGGYPRVLDAYGYTTVDTGGGSSLTLKLGNQVVNWGQMNFFPDMASAQGPVDAVKADMPGAQTQTILLPERQLLAQLQLNDKLQLLADYQFGFHRTLLPAAGSFFSQSDLSGPGAACAFDFNTGAPGAVCAGGGALGRNHVSDFGQYGLGFKYQATPYTQVGLFYLHFDDRTPFPNLNKTTFAFTTENMTDEDLVGLTTSTLVTAQLPQWAGSLAVATETTYRFHGTVLLGKNGNPSRDGHILTSGVDIFDNFGVTPLAPQTIFLFEVSGQYIDNVPTHGSSPTDMHYLNFGTRTAGAFTAQLALTYPGILSGWELSVPFEYQYQFNGRALFGPTVSGQYGGVYSVGPTMTWHQNLAFQLSYQGYTGGVDTRALTDHALADRDFTAFTVTYTF